MNTAAPRPRPVTSGATLVIVGAVFVVISAWERIAGLHTLEMQEELQRALAEPPASGLGVSLDDLQTLLRASSLVAGAVAAAMAVLGGFTLRRDPRARIGLAVLCLPLLASGLLVAGLIVVLVVVGVAMLWTPTASAWLHGRPPPAGAAGPARSAQSSQPARSAQPERSTVGVGSGAGPAASPWGSPVPQDAPTAPDPWGVVRDVQNPYHPAPPSPPRGAGRPPALIWACVVTWVSTAAVGGGLFLAALVLGLAGDEFFDEMRRQQPALESSGYSDGDLRTAVLLLAGVVVPWCVVAAVLAVLAFRGRGWARISLVVCAGLAGALVLLAAVSSPALVVGLVPLAVTVTLLARPEVGAWYRR